MKLARSVLFSCAALGLAAAAGCANSGRSGSCSPECAPFTMCCSGPGGASTCMDIVNDRNNCGTCGNVCGAGQVCRSARCEGGGDGGMMMGTDGSMMMGMCSPSCSSSQRCCGTTCISRNGVMLGSDGRSDPTFMSCTSCGAACDPDRASACSVPGGGSGMPRCMCGVYDQCSTGQRCVRDAMTTEFVCVSTATDPMNCGMVGHRCAEGESCVSGMCVCGSTGGACASGQSCCGGSCIDTTSDDMNCGGCGTGPGARACRAPAGMDLGELCCGGSCVAQDSNNCGGCGVMCDVSGDEMCVYGMDFSGSMSICCGQMPPFPGFPPFCFGGGSMPDGSSGMPDGGFFPFP